MVQTFIYVSKISVGRDINFSDIGSLQGRAPCLLNRPVRSNLAELLLNICSFTVSKCI